MDDGCNPMRWNCETRGCFNKKLRPKIEVFSQFFPRSINFGDVDGIVEIKGHALVLEWKSGKARLKEAQRRMWTSLTRCGQITVLVVSGDAETMDVYSAACFYKGEYIQLETIASMQSLGNFIQNWANYADTPKLILPTS